MRSASGLQPAEDGSAPPRDRSARASLREAIDRVRGDLQRLSRVLSRQDAGLLEPEARILEEIAKRLLLRDESEEPRDSVMAETGCGCTNLILDLRMRLLHALTSEEPALRPRGGASSRSAEDP